MANHLRGCAQCLRINLSFNLPKLGVRDSNHYGIAGYYAKMAADQGLLGISMTNTEALVVPTFGKQPMMGTNPIASMT